MYHDRAPGTTRSVGVHASRPHANSSRRRRSAGTVAATYLATLCGCAHVHRPTAKCAKQKRRKAVGARAEVDEFEPRAHGRAAGGVGAAGAAAEAGGQCAVLVEEHAVEVEHEQERLAGSGSAAAARRSRSRRRLRTKYSFVDDELNLVLIINDVSAH